MGEGFFQLLWPLQHAIKHSSNLQRQRNKKRQAMSAVNLLIWRVAILIPHLMASLNVWNMRTGNYFHSKEKRHYSGWSLFLCGGFLRMENCFFSYLRMLGWESLFMSWTSLSMLVLFDLCLFILRTITFPVVLWVTCKQTEREKHFNRCVNWFH